MPIVSALLATLLLICLLSFGWGMRYFFVQPRRKTVGMKATALVAFLTALLHFQAILSMRDVPATRFGIACAAYLASAALFWWSVRASRAILLAACFSGDGPVHLNTRGPYSLVRHPFYSSYLLASLSGLIATANVSLVPTVIAMFIIYRTGARREEAHFDAGPLAAQYSLYRRCTGRFFPKIWTMDFHFNFGSRSWCPVLLHSAILLALLIAVFRVLLFWFTISRAGLPVNGS
jgi:protein-S-isoprenylcysteine O-methyltransferase Ste14